MQRVLGRLARPALAIVLACAAGGAVTGYAGAEEKPKKPDTSQPPPRCENKSGGDQPGSQPGKGGAPPLGDPYSIKTQEMIKRLVDEDFIEPVVCAATVAPILDENARAFPVGSVAPEPGATVPPTFTFVVGVPRGLPREFFAPGGGYLRFSLDGGAFDTPRHAGTNGRLAAAIGSEGQFSPAFAWRITYRDLPAGPHTLTVDYVDRQGRPLSIGAVRADGTTASTVPARATLRFTVTRDGTRRDLARTSVYRFRNAQGGVSGYGVVYQRRSKLRWWMWGHGVRRGRHAHHIHAAGRCGQDRDIVLRFPDIVAGTRGFYQEGEARTRKRITGGARNYWNIHARPTRGGHGHGLSCANRSAR